MGRLIRYAEDEAVCCRQCRYYLAGLPQVGVCPECGKPYDKSDPGPMTWREAGCDVPRALRVLIGDARRKLLVWIIRNIHEIWVSAVILATSVFLIVVGIAAMERFYKAVGL